MSTKSEQSVQIDYINWQEVRSVKHILPSGRLYFSSTQWHPEPQWLMEAEDLTEGVHRQYAMSGIRRWIPVRQNIYDALADRYNMPRETIKSILLGIAYSGIDRAEMENKINGYINRTITPEDDEEVNKS